MVSARAALLRTWFRRAGTAALVAALSTVGTVTVVGSPRPAGADSASTDTVPPETVPPETVPPETVPPESVPPVVAPSGPGAPASGALFGATVRTGSSEAAQKSGVEALEAKLGRKLAIDHYYRPWTTTFPTSREQWDFANGRIPMISWAKTYADEIVYGVHDALIRQRADAIAALGQPLLIRWFWEMDGDRNLQYSQSPGLYVAAWQHIVSIFRQEGATNVGWVWCPNASAFADGSAQEYYPGDDWVDWTCADGYNWYRKSGDKDVSFKTIFTSFYGWATTRPKPIMVGEYGVIDTGGDRKANWVNAARTTLKSDQSGVDAAVYFNSYGYDNNDIWRDWTMDTSDSSLNAFALMGADPYFNGAPAAPTPATTIAAGSGPSGTVASRAASFTFSADQPGATFACRVDTDAFAACAAPFNAAGLSDGNHTFEARATTAAGGTDPSAARRSWTVDATGPTVSGLVPDAGATGVNRDAIAGATFSEAVTAATVSSATVQLTGPGGIAVPAGVGYSAASRAFTLTPASRLAFNTTYTVTVNGGSAGVADSLGNRMTADRVWSFTTVPPPPVPNTFLGAGPSDPSGSGSATFGFSSDQPDAAFQCRLDVAAFAACSSPATYTGLADGQHTFEVRAWTIDGGTDPDAAAAGWRVDTTAPSVSATTPIGGAGGVALDATVTAAFSEAVDPAIVTASAVSLQSGVGPVSATVAYDPTSRTATLTPAAPLTQGTLYTVTVSGGSGGVADVAGNRMAADRVWSFSTTAPVPDTVIDPASGPSGTATAGTAGFTFSSDQPGASFVCRLDGAATASACTSPWATATPLADGSHTFEVTAWTPYGGADPDPATRTWVVDTTAPTVTGVTPADGSTATATSVRATFTESVAPATVTSSAFTLVNGAGAAIAATVTWDAATTSAVLTPAAALPAGASFTATIKGGPAGVADPAGNRMAVDKVWRFKTAVVPPATRT
ncbi:MAG TPA: Ig-like domain-containing protein, partial [Acidimicrobiia bacterium]|nr:Ig-like domain-containing protein [Acidimicrobiia bacterium]